MSTPTKIIRNRRALTTEGFEALISATLIANRREQSSTLCSLIEHEHAMAVRDARLAMGAARTTLVGVTDEDVGAMIAGIDC